MSSSQIERLKDAVKFIERAAGDEDYIVAEELRTTDNETEYDIGEIPISRSLLAGLRESFVDEINDEISSIESNSKSITGYNISNHNLDTTPVQHLSKSEIPYIDRIDPVFDELNIETKRPRTGESFNFQFQATRIRHGSGQMAIVFQHFTNHQILGRSKSFKTMLGEGARQEYDEFRNELMSIPERVDALFFDGTVFVFDPIKFEKIFGYFEHYENQAEEVFSGLKDADISIHGFEDFKQSILGDNRALRKMYEIEKRGLYRTLSRDQVEEVIEAYDLEITVDVQNGTWGITLPTLRQKWEVLRLLNDDHLYSSLTEGRYQVYQKDQR